MTAAVRAARWMAIAIAVAAVIDPTLQATRPVRAEVAVVGSDHPDLTARVVETLAADFAVVRGPLPGAAATVLVGDTIPGDLMDVDGLAFAVRPARPTAARLLAVRAPDRASIHAAVQILADVSQPAGAGETTLELRSEGTVVDRTTPDAMAEADAGAEADAAARPIALSYLPVRSGAAVLQVVLRGPDGSVADTADLAVEIHDTPWPVLFHDRRPSWTSTFVRRAIEGDPRFTIATRVRTSPDVAVEIGAAPDALGALAPLLDFRVVVVGAPDALTAGEVRVLERFGREHGGTVVLPLERPAAGPVNQLIGGPRWEDAVSTATREVAPTTSASPAFGATELTWPSVLPTGARPLALANLDAGARPVVWETPLGAGAAIVAGALDAWRFRATAGSGFEPFWRRTIADAAARVLPAVDVWTSASVAGPGQRVTARVVVRDAALAESPGRTSARVSATLTFADADDADAAVDDAVVRLWPAGPPGQFQATFDAPTAPGVYRLLVESDGASGSTTLVVRAGASTPADPDGLALWTAARGGEVVDVVDLESLPGAVAAAAALPTREVAWHPMRSGWWIVPFSLLLGAEWWWRRQRGLP